MDSRSPTPRERVLTALRHEEPDRVPVDFLAAPEVWGALAAHFGLDQAAPQASQFFQQAWEQILQLLQVDCRVLSYDMFYSPPESVLQPGATIDWWSALSRSTPNRMWRQKLPDGTLLDIWGHHIRNVENPSGAYEEFVTWPLGAVSSIDELKSFPWPLPDWWDFAPLTGIVQQLDAQGQFHLRFRIGSVFELAWQLRGMQEFLMDLAIDPAIPQYIMDRITEVHVENLRRVLDLIGDRLDMVYLYDDVATQKSLMISKSMWRDFVRPRHSRIIEVARRYGKPVMYHCDGAIAPLIPELIDLGISVLNPIQPDSPGMDCQSLKDNFGDRLSFHGGIDIIKTLPRGSRADVADEVRERVRVLGQGGGYILCSSHHIQADTPLENVLTMYQLGLRYRRDN
jgi:uroporphyrinogen decarboxylase